MLIQSQTQRRVWLQEPETSASQITIIQNDETLKRAEVESKVHCFHLSSFTINCVIRIRQRKERRTLLVSDLLPEQYDETLFHFGIHITFHFGHPRRGPNFSRVAEGRHSKQQ